VSELPRYYTTHHPCYQPWSLLIAAQLACGNRKAIRMRGGIKRKWLGVLSANTLSQNKGQSEQAPTRARSMMDSVWTWNIFVILLLLSHRYIGNHPRFPMGLSICVYLPSSHQSEGSSCYSPPATFIGLSLCALHGFA
jgi:hypothetical protein